MNGQGSSGLADGAGQAHIAELPNNEMVATNNASGEIEIICGPLLNYKHLSNPETEPVWNGSVLIVTKSAQQTPQLQLRDVHGLGATASRNFEGTKLYSNPSRTFWQFSIDVPLTEQEAAWEYTLPNTRHSSSTPTNHRSTYRFFVPAAHESMRIMFHSCNGFSVGTDEDAWSGPALWNDVVRKHSEKPIHVMIGGGDQIYNDGVRVSGPLKAWTDIANPVKRRDYAFPESLRGDCDDYYFNNYVRWYSTEPFATANAQIPQINIWDDHDIIDGFGSYTDHFMKCNVFRGIGGVAFKYYSLFQHHIPPPPSTFTTDCPETMHYHDGAPAQDPRQLEDTYVRPCKLDSSFIQGHKPGPYVEERSLSIYARLGASVAFLGLDARMERTRHQINYPETYELVFQRLEQEVAASPPGKIKHLILLLGVPIAYPRLIWLENILTSPLITPIRFLNKRFGLAGGLFNHFDGQVDILDDLDDHYTSRHHKKERKALVLRLQEFAKTHNIRVTILGGDVHLAAMGRFYSPSKLNLEPERDHRYMPNIVSSAITNKPPPVLIANMLARRNRIHHLDSDTDETLMPLFDQDPGNITRTASYNHVTMPSRNYALITPANDHSDGITGGLANGAPKESHANGNSESAPAKDGHSPLHAGERDAGTKHAVANGQHSGIFLGGLDVSYQVEINQHDRQGLTEGYGFSIPPLKAA